MNPREASLRPLYNNEVRNVMRRIQTEGGLDYETAVADLVSKYGGAISPQEIGDTLYGIYSDVLGAPSARYYGVDAGAAGGGGRAGGYAAPMVTANLSDRINALNQMYDLIYKDIADLTQSRRSELEKAYGQQQEGLTGQYQDTARALPLQYAAQGVGDSSYYSKAAGRASDVYNQNLSQMEQDKQAKLGELGKFYESTMGQFQAGQQGVARTPQTITGTQADVQAAQSQLDQALQGLAGQRSGLKTNQQYVQSLQGIAPSQNMGADMLKKQLDELSVSSIPSFAKQTIGKGLISKSGQNQTFYTDYFDKLQQQQGQSLGA
jgi:hypothetical protein